MSICNWVDHANTGKAGLAVCQAHSTAITMRTESSDRNRHAQLDVNLPSVSASLLKPSASAARFRYDPLADCIPFYAQSDKNF